MNVHSRLSLFLLALGVAIGAAACGSSYSSPTASSAPVASAGATIQGTVVASVVGASAGAGGIHGLSAKAAIRVSIIGTSLVTTTDSSGKFVLTGVPTGQQVELRFEGPGIDARLDITGLTAGQTLTITVNVTGGQAVLVPGQDDDNDKNEVEFKGAIQSIDPAGGSLMVAGRKVVTNTATRIVGKEGAALALADLKVGATVEVQGMAQTDNSVLATKIKLEGSDNNGGEKEAEVKGKIESINPGAGTLVVAGKTVATDQNTRIEGHHDAHITLSDLKVGDSVEVEGVTRTDGTILAKEIKLEEEDD